MYRKKILSAFILLMTMCLIITSCKGDDGVKGTSKPQPTQVPLKYEIGALPEEFDESTTINITQPSEGTQQFNRFYFTVQSNQPLWGTLNYTVGGNEYGERFFIEATESPYLFRSYIDGFASGGVASNPASITLENKGGEAAKVTISEFYTQIAEALPESIYINNEYLKIGSRLTWGGGLDYLEYLQEDVACVTDSLSEEVTGNVTVGPGYANKAGVRVITKSVNLLNSNDPGRLVQQSYYGNGDSSYQMGTFMNTKWQYNPVQGGDQFMNASKLVDVVVTEDVIKIKCRPLDWALNNSMTPSYMEAEYKLDGRSVIVNCRFIDFSGYPHQERSQELPAFYVIEPLNSFRYFAGKKSEAWTGEGAIGRLDDLPFWPDNNYKNYDSFEYWSAWTNAEDDGFGVGLFVPGVNSLLPGVFMRGGAIRDNDPSKSDPTCYVAPVRRMKLVSYEALEYKYVISVGRVSQMREIFKNYGAIIDNSTLVGDYK